MSEPKRHHTLPQFYMERFAKDGSVDVLDRENLDKFFKAPPSKAVAETHFYSVRTADGRDTSVEKMLAAQVENPAALAFRRMFDDGHSLRERRTRAAISLFLAFQYLRGPGMRRALTEHHEVMSGQCDPRVISEWAATQHVATLAERARALAPFISARNWVVLDFGVPLLLTSDEPVTLVGPKVAEPGDAHGVRFSAQIVFSIDSRRALMMNRGDMPLLPGRLRADPDAAVIVNHHVAFNAYRSIVRQPGTDPLAGMTLAKKAPAAFRFGGRIAFQPNTSEKARASVLASIATGAVPAFLFEEAAPWDDQRGPPL